MGLRGVRWYAQGPSSGLGAAAACYMTGLVEKKVPVSWWPLGWPSDVWGTSYGPLAQLSDINEQPPELIEVAWRPIEHDAVVVCSTPLWNPALESEGKGRRLVASTAWESDRLAPEKVELLNRYDAVFVPSGFAADVLLASGVTVPLAVIPHAAPLKGPGGSAEPSRGPYTFYTIATWTTRKAIADLVDAFTRAFDASDDVSLVVHTTPVDQIAAARVVRENVPFSLEEITTRSALARALAGRRSLPDIVLSTRRLPPEGIRDLHERGDCFVSLSRGEAWNLGAFDAAAHGNPVVVTGWGGHLDYLPVGYPYLVPYELIATTEDCPDAWWSPWEGEHWAKADVQAASRLLRQVYEERQSARDLGALLQEEIGRRYARPVVTEALVEALTGTVPRR